MQKNIHSKEEAFHDQWAKSQNLDVVDIIRANEAITAPEMRSIAKQIQNHGGKKILDIGCGLGEVSVYFAYKGFDVTALDISSEMLKVTKRLAAKYNVSVNTIHSTAESLNIQKNEKFDIIYVGNLFHHVDINETLIKLKPHLKKGGMLISWDPLAYNPVINVYRKIAMGVRTDDEHPITRSDIKLFKQNFLNVKTEYYWLTTLVIFLIMYFIERRNPNKERYWKKVVEEAEKWAWIYKPLAIIDRIILFLIPPLRMLCWNIVITATNPKNKLI